MTELNLALGIKQGVQMHLEKAIEEMKLVFKDIPYDVEHTTRVLNNADLIISGKGLTTC